jgi:hypothetical protein
VAEDSGISATSITPVSPGVASLILASNSGHTPWWIGLPILVVVLIFRLGLWRARGRGARRGNDGPTWASDDENDKHDRDTGG